MLITLGVLLLRSSMLMTLSVAIGLPIDGSADARGKVVGTAGKEFAKAFCAPVAQSWEGGLK
jgi:hypothetical protein